jgi:transposase InsO family protein
MVRIHRLLQDTEQGVYHHHLGGKHKFKDACKRNRPSQRLNIPGREVQSDPLRRIPFRKKVYHNLEELQRDSDEFLYEYNFERTQKAHKLKENGYKTPAEGFFGGKTCAMLPYPLAA